MRLLRADEVAKVLQVPKQRVYELARRHALPAIRIGRQLRFRQEALETWVAALEDLQPVARYSRHPEALLTSNPRRP